MTDRDLPCLAQLEQREEGDRLLDPRERPDLLVEDEASAAAQNGSKPLQEERDGRKGECDVAQRGRRRLGGKGSESRGERRGLLRGERPLGGRSKRSRPQPEIPVGLGVELLLEPARGRPEAPVLREPLGELARRVVRVEVVERRILLLREEPSSLELEERSDVRRTFS